MTPTRRTAPNGPLPAVPVWHNSGYAVGMMRVFVLLTAGAAALFLATPRTGTIAEDPHGEGPPAGESAPAGGPAERAEGVRVAHELLTVGTIVETPRSRPAPVRRKAAANRQAGTAAPVAGSVRPSGSRVVRVLLGDGRHRPEPFPRPAR
jgi:hypothetical protein